MFGQCCEQKIVVMSKHESASFHTCVNKTKRSIIRKSFLLTLHEQLEPQKLFVTSEKMATS